MKQYDIFGNINETKEEAKPENYYGSDLNKLVAEQCKKDMTVINIDLLINDYKTGNIKIIESKHLREKMGKGQEITLRTLSRKGFDVYTIYGDEPYYQAYIYSFNKDEKIRVNQQELILFLNNQLYFCENCYKPMIEKVDCCSLECSTKIINKIL